MAERIRITEVGPRDGLQNEQAEVATEDKIALVPEDRALFFADEQGGIPAAQAFAAHNGPAAILTGPEGGFDDAERAAIRAHSAARPIALGPRILRGETAAIAAIAVWMAQAGDWSITK